MSALLLVQQVPTLPVMVQPIGPPIPPLPAPDAEWSREQTIELILRKADEHHLVRWEFLALMLAEGLNVRAARPAVQTQWRHYWEPPEPRFDVSFGLGQLSVRYSQAYEAWCRTVGITFDSPQADRYPSDAVIAMIRDTYWNPYVALDEVSTRYKYWRYNPEVPYLTAACAYNGPSYYHSPEANPHWVAYRDSGISARRLLNLPLTDQVDPVGNLTGTRTFGQVPPSSVYVQANNWTCAVRSAFAGCYQAAAEDWYPAVTYGDGGDRDVYDWLVPTYDDASVGLHIASGAGMALCLREHGYRASNQYPASYEDVLARAGRQPVMLGGRDWGHWVYCHGVDYTGVLIVCNPSPGYGGVWGSLTRDAFYRLGDASGLFSMVWIDPPS